MIAKYINFYELLCNYEFINAKIYFLKNPTLLQKFCTMKIWSHMVGIWLHSHLYIQYK